MRRCERLTKNVQRRFYDFLLTKYGVAVLLLGFILIIVCLIQLSDTLLEYKLGELKSLSNLVNPRKGEPTGSTHSTIDIKEPEFDNSYNVKENENGELLSLRTNIDVVYTWVNGSDPAHLQRLRKYRLDGLRSSNHTSFLKINYDQFYDKAVNISNTTDINQLAQWPCFHKLCMQTNNLFVILPQLTKNDKQNFLFKAKSMFSSDLFSNLSIDNIDQVFHAQSVISEGIGGGDISSNLSVLYINDWDFKTNRESLDKLRSFFRTELKDYKLFLGYYTIDCGLAINCVRNLKRTFIIKKIKEQAGPMFHQGINLNSIGNQQLRSQLIHFETEESKKHVKLELPQNISDNLLYKIDYIHRPASVYDGTSSSATKSKKYDQKSKQDSKLQTHLSVFRLKTREMSSYLSQYLAKTDEEDKDVDSSSQLIHTSSDGTKYIYDVYRANIVWDLGDPFAEDVAENRFADNDELKYSLRSLEKYAPWIRNVYIVTNGQKPSWLNISHPKVKLITHEAIFANQSHLPTFSSPAIEVNLHRIKGLSARFIYFNDDVLLGAPIWPDDFFTFSRGFRFHLAWSLPGCNPACPNSWIRDGYCDRPCNTAECDFDGGDCDKKANHTSNRNAMNSNFLKSNDVDMNDVYCSTACANTWLADKYCDRACNTFQCAFDMGDCGIEFFHTRLYQVELFTAPDLANVDRLGESMSKEFSLPHNLSHFYVNFSTSEHDKHNLSGKFRIESAIYEQNKIIRTVSVINKFNTLTVLLMSPNTTQNYLSEDPNLKNIIILASGVFVISNKTLNLTLKFKLNELNETFTNRNDAISSSSTSHTTRLSTVKINAKDAYPKRILTVSNDENQATDSNTELILANKLFKKLYENYHDYLKWSVQSGYLTESGLVYKLKVLKEKIRSEMSQTYTLVTQSDDEESKLNHMFDFFSSTGLLLNQNQLVDEYLNQTSVDDDNMIVSFKKRKLLDTFADSLRHVNRLYNQMYGYMTRKVPAHMPHFIDRRIMSRLQDKFRSQFDQTSSNRFRSKNDMQYAFAYYYYVMSEVEEFNASKLFDEELDLNANGQLDLSEIMILNLRMSTHSFSTNIDNDINDMFNLSPELAGHLNQCSNAENGTRVLRRSLFLSCQDLVDFVRDGLWNPVSEKVGAKRNKYKYEALGDEGTKFVMISGDPLEIQVKLNNLIREPRKFVCLNDNIDYKMRTEAKRLKEIISSFYTSLFPLKSSFEVREENASRIVMVEYSSPINFFQSHSTGGRHGGLSQQRLFFFLPILVGIFVFLLILIKRLLFKDSTSPRFGRFTSPHSIIIKKNPVRIASKGSSGMIRSSSFSNKKQRTPSKAFISKMENNVPSSSDTESHLIMNSSDDDEDNSTSSSSSGQKPLSTVKNEVAHSKRVSLSIREGLTRKKKVIKKLNITTI